MAYLLTQPQQKLQLDYKTSITQNNQKIGMEMWRRGMGGPTPTWWIKIGMDTLGTRDPCPTPDHPAQGSSASKCPNNFWIWRPVGLG